jgi:hypothetical protein
MGGDGFLFRLNGVGNLEDLFQKNYVVICEAREGDGPTK